MKQLSGIEAVIFDKDGTLLDFDLFWVKVSQKAIAEVLVSFDAKKDLLFSVLEGLGVRNGITDINGALCKGTYEEIGEIVYKILIENGYKVLRERVIETVVRSYHKNINAGEIKPTCSNLLEILQELKRQNKKLVVVTTDTEQITRKCLQKLGIDNLFEKIYTDDGKAPPKPNPYCALDFCKNYNIKKKRVVMVGDTLTDVSFAKNAGIAAIGFAKSEKNKAILKAHTDIVISDMSQLLELLK